MGRDAVEPYPMRQTRVMYEQRLVMEPIVAPQPQRSYKNGSYKIKRVYRRLDLRSSWSLKILKHQASP